MGAGDWVSNIPLASMRILTEKGVGGKEEEKLGGNSGALAFQGPGDCQLIALDLSTSSVLLDLTMKPGTNGSRNGPK